MASPWPPLRLAYRPLSGLRPEAVALLKDRPVAAGLFRILKRMLRFYRIEAAERMIAMDRFTIAPALPDAMRRSQLVPEEKPRP